MPAGDVSPMRYSSILRIGIRQPPRPTATSRIRDGKENTVNSLLKGSKRKRLVSDDALGFPSKFRVDLTMSRPEAIGQDPHSEEGRTSSPGSEHLHYHPGSEDTLCEATDLVHSPEHVDDHGVLVAAGDTFWFEDGNVILVAGDTQFRVYQGLLAAHSPVLAHILSSSSAPADSSCSEDDISGKHDGCLVVHLTDSPEDLRHILRLFMPSAPMTAAPTFELVSAYIRLGLKYEIRQVYDTALDILKNRYTDSFDHWESLGNRASPPGFEDMHAVGVVNLVRLIGDSTMLPVALWQCCRLGSDLVHGFTRVDGTRENLTLEDLGLCFAAQERLIQAGVRARLRIFSPVVSERCKKPTVCKEAFAKACQSLEKKTDLIASTDPFVPYTRICFEGVLGLCSTCSSEVKARDRKERRAIWDRLPALLGLDVPGWGKVAGTKSN